MHTQLILDEKSFHEFMKLIHELTGITVASHRTSLIEGRLRKHVGRMGLDSYGSYLKMVKENDSEKSRFIDLITTNETSFFRTPRVWEYIEKKFLPEWHSKNPNDVLMIWSAASSSGEEAYSLAMLCENFRRRHMGFKYQIQGSDISNEMVTHCKSGEFSGRSVAGLKNNRPELFDQFMRQTDHDSCKATDELKTKLRFFRHNLFEPLKSRETYDLILLRNVMIYFKGPDQEKVLDLIAPRLKPTGNLIIGESESLSHIRTSFKPVEPLVYSVQADAHTSALKAV